MKYNRFNLLFKFVILSILISMMPSCTTIITDKSAIPMVDDENTNENYSVAWKHIEGWAKDDIRQAWAAWLNSCSKLQSKIQWTKVCQLANYILPNDINAQREYFENNFTPKHLTSSSSKITGYYEPVLQGSRVYTAKFKFPIYKYPEQWKYKKPIYMPTRSELMSSNFLKGQELAYLDNPIDVAFLQVQGSGQIILDNKQTISVTYAGNNGHSFKSFAQWLIDKKELTRGSAGIPGIRAWAANNSSEKVNEMLNSNPRFIFFAENNNLNTQNDVNKTSAIGALGVLLTPQRSIAVDTNYIQLGSPVFLSTSNPAGGMIQKLVMAQDIGNAIKGSVRADFFWGSGDEAGELAGRTNFAGDMWVLIPKENN